MRTQNSIRVLPPEVVNKIAAGEVVERPASVAKELMENAVDAGATQIDVEIVYGGRKLVSVSDNGLGMGRDDALLSIERHATSKIRDVEDIVRIGTLGFRGEALAAIASVSRFRLSTCRTGEIVGTEILAAGGKMQDARDIGRPAGTSVEVRDIFFNVPARRKFLRSAQWEQDRLKSVFVVQALAQPCVGMSLKLDGQESHRLPAGGTLEERIRDLFGPDCRKGLMPVSHKEGDIRISGYAAVPQLSRSDRDEQYIFVNGRATSAPVIAYAVRESYRTLLPKDRHAVVFLFVEIDAGLVDVNVHPAKREVRFLRSDMLRDAVIAAIRGALGAGPALPAPAPKSAAPLPELKISDLPLGRVFQYPRAGPLTASAQDMMPPSAGPGGKARVESTGGPEPENGKSPWTWCRVVGQVGSLYVVLETEDGMVLMDPHAAHERVLFETYMAEISRGKVEIQTLLFPETAQLRPNDAMRLRKNIELFKGMGFSVSDFGGDSFVVDAVPACVAEASCGNLLCEIAQALEQSGARGGRERWREEAVAQAACKAAVKARTRLSLREIEELVVRLAQAEMPYTCPHGRPTVIFTSFKDLARKFGRE